MARKPFIPRDKPKSWVIFVSAGLIGLLVAGPLVLLGDFLAWGWLIGLATLILVLCVFAGFVMWIIFAVGHVSGRYQGIGEKNWEDQVW